MLECGGRMAPCSSCRLWRRSLSVRSRPASCPRTSGSKISDPASRGLGPTAIGRELGRAASTISRELPGATCIRRGSTALSTPIARPRSDGTPEPSDEDHDDRALFESVLARLRLRRVLSRSVGHCAVSSPSEPSMWLATKSIYQALYRHQTELLRRANDHCDGVATVGPRATIGAGTRAPVRAGWSFRPAGALAPTTAASSQPTGSRPPMGRRPASSVRSTARPSQP